MKSIDNNYIIRSFYMDILSIIFVGILCIFSPINVKADISTNCVTANHNFDNDLIGNTTNQNGDGNIDCISIDDSPKYKFSYLLYPDRLSFSVTNNYDIGQSVDTTFIADLYDNGGGYIGTYESYQGTINIGVGFPPVEDDIYFVKITGGSGGLWPYEIKGFYVVEGKIYFNLEDIPSDIPDVSGGYNGPNFVEWLFVSGVFLFVISFSLWGKIFRPLITLFK